MGGDGGDEGSRHLFVKMSSRLTTESFRCSLRLLSLYGEFSGFRV